MLTCSEISAGALGLYGCLLALYVHVATLCGVSRAIFFFCLVCQPRWLEKKKKKDSIRAYEQWCELKKSVGRNRLTFILDSTKNYWYRTSYMCMRISLFARTSPTHATVWSCHMIEADRGQLDVFYLQL